MELAVADALAAAFGPGALVDFESQPVCEAIANIAALSADRSDPQGCGAATGLLSVQTVPPFALQGVMFMLAFDEVIDRCA